MIARKVRISGRVQGVFFRAWTQQQAQSLGVAGWVRNSADGSVEALLEGEDDAVAQLLERISSGPPAARVDHVEAETAEACGLDGFDVRG